MKTHPIAEIFPLMSEEPLVELTEDIRQNGQLAPITLYEGKILDGRNRYAAVKKLKLKPKTRELGKGQDPLQFVISANLHRRHLTTSQRAMVAAKIANMPVGRPQKKTPQICGVSETEAANSLSVAPRSVSAAKKVLTEGTPEEAMAVVNGKETVSAAAKAIKERQAREAEVVLDSTGYPIPETVRELWNRNGEGKEILRLISAARNKVKPIHDDDDPLYYEVNMNAVLAKLNDAYRELSQSVMYAVCPYCQGRGGKKCTNGFCKDRGLVSRFRLKMVPEELMNIRAKAGKP